MNDTELLRRMVIRLIARVSALEAATEGMLEAHARLHGLESLQELVALMHRLPPRPPEEYPENMEDWLRTEQQWCLEELCKNVLDGHQEGQIDPSATS